MSYEELHPEEEVLSREDEKARRLLGSLKRVDAPRDFDFRLKARIAGSKPGDFAAPRLFPSLRYVAPLSLAIVVLAVLVFNGLYSFDSKSSVPEIVEKVSQKSEEKWNSEVGNRLPKQIFSETNTQKTNTENSDKKESITFPKNPELAAKPEKPKSEKLRREDDGGYSRNSAVSVPPVFYPKDRNLNKNVEKPKDLVAPTSLPVKEALTQIGIEAVYSDNKWKVVSVKQDSPAAKSGVKTNDIVEAIDENQITTETASNKTINGKSLRVTRDGKKVEIKLQDK